MNSKSLGVMLTCVVLGVAVSAIGNVNVAIGASIGCALGAGLVGAMDERQSKD